MLIHYVNVTFRAQELVDMAPRTLLEILLELAATIGTRATAEEVLS